MGRLATEVFKKLAFSKKLSLLQQSSLQHVAQLLLIAVESASINVGQGPKYISVVMSLSTFFFLHTIQITSLGFFYFIDSCAVTFLCVKCNML